MNVLPVLCWPCSVDKAVVTVLGDLSIALSVIRHRTAPWLVPTAPSRASTSLHVSREISLLACTGSCCMYCDQMLVLVEVSCKEEIKMKARLVFQSTAETRINFSVSVLASQS